MNTKTQQIVEEMYNEFENFIESNMGIVEAQSEIDLEPEYDYPIFCGVC